MAFLRPAYVSPSFGATRHLLPEREKNGPALALIPLPLGERVDRAQRETGEGVRRWAFALIPLFLTTATSSAASLVLPHERYGNSEGCAFLATGDLDNDALQFLTRDELSTYGSGCRIVDVHADKAGNQRIAGICSSEGEEMLGAEDFVVAAPLSTGAVLVYTATGEIWGELEPCS